MSEFSKKRRDFLKIAGLDALILSAFGPAAIAESGDISLDFLHLNNSFMSMMQKDGPFYKFGKVTEITDPSTLRSFQTYATPELKKITAHLPEDEIVQVTPLQETSGMPETREAAKDMINYGKFVHDIFVDKVRSVEKIDIKWTDLNNYDYHTNDYNGRIFVGKKTKLRQWAEGKGTSERFYTSSRQAIRGGAFGYLEPSPDGKRLNEFFGFLSSDNTILQSPNSEIIPVYVWEAIEAVNKSQNRYESRVASETISESISYLISQEALKEKGLTDLVNTHNTNFEKAMVGNPQYVHVNSAIKWTKENGIQNAFEFFMENPIAYMEIMKKN